MNGPFLLPVPVLQAVLSILIPVVFDPVLLAVVVEVEEEGAAGRGKIARRRVVLVDVAVPAEADEAGDDLDEVVDLGEGPFQGGEGVEVAIVVDVKKVNGGW